MRNYFMAVNKDAPCQQIFIEQHEIGALADGVLPISSSL